MEQAQQNHQCGHCGRKAFRTPTNRCMYCGKPLPEALKLSAAELAAFKQKHQTVPEQNPGTAPGADVRGFDLPSEPRRKPKRRKGLIRRMVAWLLETLSGTRGS